MTAPLNVKEFAAKALRGEISVTEHTARILEEAKKQNARYHHFCVIAEKEAMEQIKKAVDFALNSPLPDTLEIEEDVYA